jgi:hypothetical protein
VGRVTTTTTDRERRAVVVCACCGRTGAHRGHGLCVACYARWVYWGRPPQGPPLPGSAPPRRRRATPRAISARCRSRRHALTGGDLIISGSSWACRACRPASEARYRSRRFARRHDGHDITATRDGRPYCRTCARGDHLVDEIAVERAVRGDPPQRLSIAERELAVIQLRAWGLTYAAISQRTGCNPRTAYAICKRLGAAHATGARRRMAERSAA